MTPDQIVHIGPLAFALDRLVAVAMFLAFIAAIDRIAGRWGTAIRRPGLVALVAGLVVARAAYVLRYRESFALDPMEAIRFWLGGWHWVPGVAAASLVLIVVMRTQRGKAAGLATLGMLSLLWLGFLTGSEKPAPLRLPPALSVDLEKGRTQLQDLQGRPVVLNLWATWCPPCRRELPMLVSAAREEERATILLVNQGEDTVRVRQFLREQGLDPAAVAFDQRGVLGALAGKEALPTTLFIDGRGNVQHTHVGELRRVQLDIALREMTGLRRSEVSPEK